MKGKKYFKYIARLNISGVAMLIALTVSAGSLAVGPVELKPHKIGDTKVTSIITSGLGYGDNVFRGSIDETSSTFFSFKPEVNASRETSEQRLNLSYAGDGVVFVDSSDDNYFSNKVSAEYVRNINEISQFSVGASFEDGSSVRGTDSSEGINNDVRGATDFTRKDVSLGYLIASQKTGPSLKLGYNLSDLGYDNFESINQGRDYKLDELTARLGYQYSVATNVFIDLSSRNFNYDGSVGLSGLQLDNRENTVHVGVNWRFSRLTFGEVSVGTTDKNFDNFQDPRSFTTWNALVEWTPTARDTVSLESFSKPFEQAGTGLFQDIDQTSLSWQRELSKKISLSGALTVGSVDLGNVGRVDDFDSVNIGLLYRPTRHSSWSLSYEREEKDSSVSRFNFDINTLLLSYTASL